MDLDFEDSRVSFYSQNSAVIEKSEDLPTRICIVNTNGNTNPGGGLHSVAQSFGVPVIYSGPEEFGPNFENDNYDTIFILHQFEGPDFENIKKYRRILGPTVLKELAMREEPLPNYKHPLFCSAMVGVKICFSGFRDKSKLRSLIEKARYMGASVRSHTERSTTHLVSMSCMSNSYRVARAYGIPVMSGEWITRCWDNRFQTEFSAELPDMMKYTMQVLAGIFLCFYGFSTEVKEDIEKTADQNGGVIVTLCDPRLTHVVFDENNISRLPGDLPTHMYSVTSVWFWTSVKDNAIAVEEQYSMRQSLGSLSSRSDMSTSRFSTGRKRPQRLRRVPSSVNMNWTTTSSIDEPPVFEEHLISDVATPSKSKSRRDDVFQELLRTETNYVKILSTLLEVKKELLSETQLGGPILKSPEANIIFTNLQVIHDSHCSVLLELGYIADNWSDDTLIGPVFTKFGPELRKEYPAFVNYFESSRKMLFECDKTNTRFHAFLQVCKSRPEFHRQTLQELMIRPVQRLASTVLILHELQKRTEPTHPDHAALELALKEVNQVVALIDEEKKKSEVFSYMFQIYNLIEGCPANLLSSTRDLYLQFEAIEVKHPGLGKPGNRLVFFVFSDLIEVCKVKSKVIHLGDSVSPQHVLSVTNGHPYKHIATIPLGDIRRVVDIKDNSNIVNAFSIHVRRACDIEEKSYSVQLTGRTCSKREVLELFVSKISRGLSYDVLVERTPEEEGIHAQPINTSTPLGKALSFAYKSTFRMGAALGFHRSSTSEIGIHLPGVGSTLSMNVLPGSPDITESNDMVKNVSGGIKTSSLTTSLMKRL